MMKKGDHSGYVAYNPKTDEWFFPKGFKRTLYNGNHAASEVVHLTVSIWETLELIKQDTPSVSLIGKTMTDIQAEQLSKFFRVIVHHPEPDNLVVRLARNTFVKVA